ncbi:hypothetical protein [Pseudoalteromonas xiamenensis]
MKIKDIALLFAGILIGFSTRGLISDTLFGQSTSEQVSSVTTKTLEPLTHETVRQRSAQSKAAMNIVAQPVNQATILELNEARETEKDTVFRLEKENARLLAELANLQSEIDANSSMPEMAEKLRNIFIQENRDPVFADETEMQVKDFIYQFGFSDRVEVKQVGCKTSVCEIHFVPKESDEFDSKLWRELSDKLHETPWWKKFQAMTSRSTDEQLVILATTQWQTTPQETQ